MQNIVDAVLSADATAEDIAALALPDSYRGAVVLAEESTMFEGLADADKDPAKSLHLRDVPTPEPGPGEVLIAVLASAINYNTVWSALFEPLPTFAFLERWGRTVPGAARHDLPYHVLGSDAAGVVLRVGPGVTRWKPGDHVVAHCLAVDLDHPDGHDDTMRDPHQRIWGYETNFGGLAELALLQGNQLMPKAAHLTWEEAASSSLVHSTAYRQLVSRNGAQMKQGDIVLIWGGAGGLGSYATQLVRNGGGRAVCVVSSQDKARLAREAGAESVIDRRALGFRFWSGDEPDPGEWRRFGKHIRELTGGDDPDIVFEHPGRETFGASVFVARRGGTIVTCASSSGYDHRYDNRYLWMHVKRIIGTHFANYREAWEANRLITRGVVHPTLSAVYPLGETGHAVRTVHRNDHSGKVGILCLAPHEGLGVTDPELRARHLPAINRFRRPVEG
ncbi:crotonyl-CoA carboxylase/reductase [Amycolatopsis pigmentata]|uniref:Crotonyl-CoA carboxylase/reductase n=1 Tax=Amycolatopsis pigmentata TaxID=450801 RepID=A0ABW5G170_9PSEU